MAFTHKLLAKAIRNVLRGEHTFQSADRNNAVIEVRDICEDRIHVERREASVKLPWVNINIAGEDPQYSVQTGRTKNSKAFVEVILYSHNPAERTRLADAVVQAIDSMAGVDVTIDDQTLSICSCYQEGGSDTSDAVPDSSGDYSFEHELTFRVSWDRPVSSRFN